jgi:hypothetical protein
MPGKSISFGNVPCLVFQKHFGFNSFCCLFIHRYRGMVSLPALKSLMLQASRIIKGASVADRIMFCGVPCFVLSKDPAPELATSLQRQAKQRFGESAANLSQLSTIAETETHEEQQADLGGKSFAGSCGNYRQRDVILHLTGGGFFAHTIASDLPYLLDWSSSTGAVVICPEVSRLDIMFALEFRGRQYVLFTVNHILILSMFLLRSMPCYLKITFLLRWIRSLQSIQHLQVAIQEENLALK